MTRSLAPVSPRMSLSTAAASESSSTTESFDGELLARSSRPANAPAGLPGGRRNASSSPSDRTPPRQPERLPSQRPRTSPRAASQPFDTSVTHVAKRKRSPSMARGDRPFAKKTRITQEDPAATCQKLQVLTWLVGDLANLKRLLGDACKAQLGRSATVDSLEPALPPELLESLQYSLPKFDAGEQHGAFIELFQAAMRLAPEHRSRMLHNFAFLLPRLDAQVLRLCQPAIVNATLQLDTEHFAQPLRTILTNIASFQDAAQLLLQLLETLPRLASLPESAVADLLKSFAMATDALARQCADSLEDDGGRTVLSFQMVLQASVCLDDERDRNHVLTMLSRTLKHLSDGDGAFTECSKSLHEAIKACQGAVPGGALCELAYWHAHMIHRPEGELGLPYFLKVLPDLLEKHQDLMLKHLKEDFDESLQADRQEMQSQLSAVVSAPCPARLRAKLLSQIAAQSALLPFSEEATLKTLDDILALPAALRAPLCVIVPVLQHLPELQRQAPWARARDATGGLSSDERQAVAAELKRIAIPGAPAGPAPFRGDFRHQSAESTSAVVSTELLGAIVEQLEHPKDQLQFALTARHFYLVTNAALAAGRLAKSGEILFDLPEFDRLLGTAQDAPLASRDTIRSLPMSLRGSPLGAMALSLQWLDAHDRADGMIRILEAINELAPAQRVEPLCKLGKAWSLAGRDTSRKAKKHCFAAMHNAIDALPAPLRIAPLQELFDQHHDARPTLSPPLFKVLLSKAMRFRGGSRLQLLQSLALELPRLQPVNAIESCWSQLCRSAQKISPSLRPALIGTLATVYRGVASREGFKALYDVALSLPKESRIGSMCTVLECFGDIPTELDREAALTHWLLVPSRMRDLSETDQSRLLAQMTGCLPQVSRPLQIRAHAIIADEIAALMERLVKLPLQPAQARALAAIAAELLHHLEPQAISRDFTRILQVAGRPLEPEARAETVIALASCLGSLPDADRAAGTSALLDLTALLPGPLRIAPYAALLPNIHCLPQPWQDAAVRNAFEALVEVEIENWKEAHHTLIDQLETRAGSDLSLLI